MKIKNAITYEEYSKLHPETQKNRNDPMFSDPRNQLQQQAPVQAPVQQAPVQQAPVQQAPAQQSPVQQSPVQQAPVQQAPVQQAPVQQAPVQQAPVQQAPVQQAPVQQAPVQQAPVQQTPQPAKKHTVSGNPKIDGKISTYLNKMKDIVNKARASGEKPPNFDLCEVSVPGTNLFCGQNKGIERKKMPQLKGTPAPNTDASKLPAGADGEVSIEKPFVDALKSKGVRLTPKNMNASHLKATQSQLVGSKVVGMIGALEKNPNDPNITAPIFVSKDGYVLDGHHRWAAVVGLNFFSDKPVTMNVVEVDMGIDDLVNFTNNFADQMGIRQKAARLRLIAASLRAAGNNEPTNPSLWEKVQKLTKGEIKSISHGGKTVNGPNEGKGFTVFPSAYANGWASKTYKDLGGGWKKKS